jgi:hypothetical protein
MKHLPDFAGGTHGFHHTVDSALSTLAQLGVPPSRIRLTMGGFGYPSRWIIRQHPPPGEVVTSATMVTLVVAGSGLLHSLPVGMWDWGGEAELGTAELVDVFDDPLQKASHWLREGARLFDVQPEHRADCERWISLFGLVAEEWPAELWYPLAVLLPNLKSLAGTERGVRSALQLLFGLPLLEILRKPAYSMLPGEECSRLGYHASRIGVDAVVGDRTEDLGELIYVLGPVSLSRYCEYQQPERKRLMQRFLSLLTPFDRKCSIRWSVLDASMQPRLGFEEQNARLGLNSHLGRRKPETVSALPLAPTGETS